MSRIQDTRFLPMRGLLLAAALGAAMLPAMAFAEATVEELSNPDTVQFSFGLAHVDNDNQRFGMYNGLEDDQGYAIGSLNIVQRNDENGTWMRLNGRNIGLSTQEFAGEIEHQGDWRIAIDYSQIPRMSPYDIHTSLHGIGSNDLSYGNFNNNPQTAINNPVNFAAIRETNLETNRYKTRIELSRYFTPAVEFKVLFQNEHKQGERLFGRGTSTGAGNVVQEFLAEPIDYMTRQLDLALNYTGDRLQLSGGYYGSFFSNDDPALNITGGATNLRTVVNGAPPFTPIALPPDNYSHQFSLMGGYQFTSTTRGNFKLAYSHAYQEDDFISVMNCNPGGISNCNTSGRNDLGGHLDTKLVDLGLTSRPIPKLNLVAKLRYEDRDDKTSVARYIIPTGTTSSTNGFNEPRSLTVESGKLEATYQLPQGFNLTGGVDAERRDRSIDGVRVVGYRSRVEEMTYRLGLRRSLADALTGAVSYERSDRTGSDFRTLRTWDTTLNGGTGGFNMATPGGLYVLGGLMQPIYMADRDRHKIKLSLDWMPTDALSFQFNAEDSRDDYQNGRYEQAEIGAREGQAWQINFDATYAMNDNWKFSAWASRDQTSMDQADCVNKTSLANCAANSWTSELTSRTDAVGFSARGKNISKLKLNLGADLTYMRDRNEYDLAGKGTAAAATDLPTITSYMTTLKLFANYPVGKESSVQLDYILDHRKTTDWTWDGYQYTDGTTLDQNMNETVHFIGASFRYGFR